ncbi:hypothetical protein PHYC_00319 [Phycisphaerales bacterium]|nr:hypothetical protein PHYC_00319 [Phycisphaerales bacterium]
MTGVPPAQAHDSGRVLASTVESIRIEQTYHSNAIEGSTRTLRETQRVIEGQYFPAGKSLREVYEARHHDRAVRLIERGPRLAPPMRRSPRKTCSTFTRRCLRTSIRRTRGVIARIGCESPGLGSFRRVRIDSRN